MKELPEIHQHGMISMENMPEKLEFDSMKGELGIQIAKDGRIWICINGIAFLRFKPEIKEKI